MYKITQTEHIDADIGANPNQVDSIGKASPLHCHDYYEFFLITEGRCVHRVNGAEQHLNEGDLVFIRPDDAHCYDYEDGSDCSFLNLACTRDAVESAIAYLGAGVQPARLLEDPLPVCAALEPSEWEAYINAFERLKTLATIDKTRANLLLRAMLADTLSRYFPSGRRQQDDRLPQWFEGLLTQMQHKNNFTAGIERLHVLSGHSRGHVSRMFRRYLDTTPVAYINSLRLNYAKNLLQLTRIRVIDIALDAGFENLSHFNHVFKKHFGAAPSTYRRK